MSIWSAGSRVEAKIDELSDFIKELKELWQIGKCSEAYFCALYILIHLLYKHHHKFKGAKFSQPLEKMSYQDERSDPLLLKLSQNFTFLNLSSKKDFWNLWCEFSLREIPQKVQRVLLEVEQSKFILHLKFEVPVARDILHWQSLGQRCVSAICDKPNLLKPVFDKPNAMTFLIHDLEHAHGFWFNAINFKTQMGFYQKIKQAMDHGLFPIGDSSIDWQLFDYVISDMNAYCVHLLKCLKFSIKNELIYHSLLDFWSLSNDQKIIFEKVNLHPLTESDQLSIEAFFAQR